MNSVRPTRVETSGFELTETTVTKESSLWPPLGSASPAFNTLAAHERDLVSSNTIKHVVPPGRLTAAYESLSVTRDPKV